MLSVHASPVICLAGALRGSQLGPELQTLSLPTTHALFAESLGCCAPAGIQDGPAALAACAARRWLARNAAGVKALRSLDYMNHTHMSVPASISLVSCLPALEDVELCLHVPVVPSDLGCLLEALAWLPRFRALHLFVENIGMDKHTDLVINFDDDAYQPCPDTSAFAKLRSLTRLALSFDKDSPYTVAGMVDALISMSRLATLELGFPQSTVVPAALGQLQGLRRLVLKNLRHCALEAGCLALPNLISLDFDSCWFADPGVLPGITALQSLTSIKSYLGRGPCLFDHQLVQLPRVQHIVSNALSGGDASCWLSRLPTDMGALRSTLLYLSCYGVGIFQFPLVLMQLVALHHLDVSNNGFTVVPTAITALSRLTELVLGQASDAILQQGERPPLDARALGDLLGFPLLCRLAFSFYEVTLCMSILGAVRHARLASIAFTVSYPAPECALIVLQLSQALRRLGRGSVLSFKSDYPDGSHAEQALQSAHALPPLHKFHVALHAYWM